MIDRRLVFLGPGRVEVEAFDAGRPGAGQVELHSLVSAISAGTESLLWKGLWPGDLPLDDLWNSAKGSAAYPVRYGYAVVGRVGTLGVGVDPSWAGQRAFGFLPHQGRAVVDADRLIRLPSTMDAEDGVFLASMETALTLAQDAAPVVGETVGLWGLGTIGLLTALALGASFDVRVWDREPTRRVRAESLGLKVERPPASSCDVTLDLTGQPEALNEAVAATRFSGRVIAGSWYGARPVALDLGGAFHRSRVRILSSQVSTMAPELAGRWTKERRLQAALDLAARTQPSRLISHRFPLEDASQAYEQACDRPNDGLQVVFSYSGGALV